MSKSHYRPKPTAMFVTVIALSFALADWAVAETDAVARAISTAKVRRIARSVANQEINIRAPGLSVGSAVSAQSANTANTANFANSANPVLFARVFETGVVDAANSKGVGSANVDVPLPGIGIYCFSGLPAIKGGQVTPDFSGGIASEFGQLGFGNLSGQCPPVTQFFVVTISRTANGLIFDPGAFFLHLYQ